MKLAIIGGRDFTNYDLVVKTIDNLGFNFTHIVSGGAKGADSLGEKYAKDNNIPFILFRAEWDRYGNRAGPIRNKQIIDESDIVVAFWDGLSKGTAHSIKLARQKGIKVIIVKY